MSDPPTSLPDFLLSPEAVLHDDHVAWRRGSAPDYSSTRALYEREKTVDHEKGGFAELVQNLVKNWEIEASHKTLLSDWRTIDPAKFTFSMNGGPARSAEETLQIGTYNAILDGGTEWYDARWMDFKSSHDAFSRAMKNFAWEVLSVAQDLPRVFVQWRHWGYMTGAYRGVNK